GIVQLMPSISDTRAAAKSRRLRISSLNMPTDFCSPCNAGSIAYWARVDEQRRPLARRVTPLIRSRARVAGLKRIQPTRQPDSMCVFERLSSTTTEAPESCANTEADVGDAWKQRSR